MPSGPRKKRVPSGPRYTRVPSVQGIQRVHSGPRYTRVPSDHRYTKNTHWSEVCKRYMVVPGRQMVLLKVQGINVYIYM